MSNFTPICLCSCTLYMWVCSTTENNNNWNPKWNDCHDLRRPNASNDSFMWSQNSITVATNEPIRIINTTINIRNAAKRKIMSIINIYIGHTLTFGMSVVSNWISIYPKNSQLNSIEFYYNFSSKLHSIDHHVTINNLSHEIMWQYIRSCYPPAIQVCANEHSFKCHVH